MSTYLAPKKDDESLVQGVQHVSENKLVLVGRTHLGIQTNMLQKRKVIFRKRYAFVFLFLLPQEHPYVENIKIKSHALAYQGTQMTNEFLRGRRVRL